MKHQLMPKNKKEVEVEIEEKDTGEVVETMTIRSNRALNGLMKKVDLDRFYVNWK